MELKCHFCDKLHEQVGQLSCKHQICAGCFRSISSVSEKCSICILNSAQLNRAKLRIMAARSDVSPDSASPESPENTERLAEKAQKQFVFCTNDGCDFIGTRAELASHVGHCKFQLLSESSAYETNNPGLLAASAVENATNISRELTHLELYKQMEDISHRMNTLSKQLENHTQERVQEGNQRNDEALETATVTPITTSTVGYFEAAAIVIIAVLVVHWYHVSKDSSTLLHDSRDSSHSGRNVAVTFKGVDDLVMRARFNKRDVVLSEQRPLQQYKVKLAFGGSLSATEAQVNLWVGAQVSKKDGIEWAVGEVLRLSLEHNDPEKRRYYEFLSTHSGTWKESVRVHKGELLFRQIQVESAQNKKYLRFSCVLNYEEALAAGYVKDDSVTVRLDIRA